MNIRSIARRAFYDQFYIKPIMPNLLRLALIDGLTYNSEKKIGGAINNYHNVLIKKSKVAKGLNSSLKVINQVKEEGNHITNMLSIPDLIQIGGAAAVEYAGGPFINVK